jgi:2-phosphosulfolactate phosphatase
MDRDRVFVTGLMTARLTAAHAESLGEVEYIPSDPNGDEDIACADYMRGEIDLLRARQRIVASRAAHKFLDDEMTDFPRTDLDMCLQEKDTGFVMEVRSGEAPIVERVNL